MPKTTSKTSLKELSPRDVDIIAQLIQPHLKGRHFDRFMERRDWTPTQVRKVIARINQCSDGQEVLYSYENFTSLLEKLHPKTATQTSRETAPKPKIRTFAVSLTVQIEDGPGVKDPIGDAQRVVERALADYGCDAERKILGSVQTLSEEPLDRPDTFLSHDEQEHYWYLHTKYDRGLGEETSAEHSFIRITHQLAMFLESRATPVIELEEDEMENMAQLDNEAVHSAE